MYSTKTASGTLDIYMQCAPYFPPYVKLVKDQWPRCRKQNYTTLCENMGVNIYDLGFGNDFWDMIIEVNITKEGIKAKLMIMNIKTFVFRHPTESKKILLRMAYHVLGSSIWYWICTQNIQRTVTTIIKHNNCFLNG